MRSEFVGRALLGAGGFLCGRAGRRGWGLALGIAALGAGGGEIGSGWMLGAAGSG
jgi:hypothetical protein